MTKSWKYFLIGALIVVLMAARAVSGSFAGSESEDSDLTILPGESEGSILQGNAWIGDESGQTRMIAGLNYRVQPGTPEEMAAVFLTQEGEKLGLKSATLDDLEHSFTHSGPSGHTVRFDQYYGGIPVYKGEIAVHLNNEATVTLVTNDYKTTAEVSVLKSSISSDQARDIAFRYLNVQSPIRYESSELVVFRGKTSNRLAYQVLVIAAAPLGDWEVLVDAHSGEIFKTADIALYLEPGDDDQPAGKEEAVQVDGSGNVFAPDPLSSAGATYGDPGFVDGFDADTSQMTAEVVNVTLPDIQFSPGTGLYTLIGPWAQIVDVEAPFNGLFPQGSSTFNYTRNADAFEAANGYYHIDGYMRYVNSTLGISVAPYQYVGGVKYDPSGFNGADNSRYSSVTGDLSFGEGGVDDAEDADVLIHELGHGLHDWLTGGNLSQINGLSEGVGDYVAQSYSRAYGQWMPAEPPYHWVFSWDGHNEFWEGRITNYGAIYPGGLTGQIHTDGQIWSTCNMKIWDAIGQVASDRAHLEGLSSTGSSTNQEQAANAVFQAAIDMGYSAADLLTMKTLFESCGYVMINLPGGDFDLDASPPTQSVCAPSDAIYTVDVIEIGSFSQPVTLSTSGEPAGTTASFSTNPVIPPGSSMLTIGNTGSASAGNYSIDVIGIAPTSTHTTTVGLELSDGIPGTPSLNTPPDGATGLPLEPSFTWTGVSGAAEYLLEVALDAGFVTVVYSANETTTAHTIPGGSGLNPSTQYFWRVTAANGCGPGIPSGAFSFSTKGVNQLYLPVVIKP